MQGSVIAPGAAPARAGSCCRRGAAGGGAAHCPQHERLQTPTAARRTTSGFGSARSGGVQSPDPGGDPERRKSATASSEPLGGLMVRVASRGINRAVVPRRRRSAVVLRLVAGSVGHQTERRFRDVLFTQPPASCWRLTRTGAAA